MSVSELFGVLPRLAPLCAFVPRVELLAEPLLIVSEPMLPELIVPEPDVPVPIVPVPMVPEPGSVGVMPPDEVVPVVEPVPEGGMPPGLVVCAEAIVAKLSAANDRAAV